MVVHVTIAHVAIAWLLDLGVLGFAFWGIKEAKPRAPVQRRAFVIATCLLCTPVVVPELSTTVPWPLGSVIALSLLDDPDWLLEQAWMLFAVFLAGALAVSITLSRWFFPDPPTTTTP